MTEAEIICEFKRELQRPSYQRIVRVLEDHRNHQSHENLGGDELRKLPALLEKKLGEPWKAGKISTKAAYDAANYEMRLCDESLILWADEPRPKDREFWTLFIELAAVLKEFAKTAQVPIQPAVDSNESSHKIAPVEAPKYVWIPALVFTCTLLAFLITTFFFVPHLSQSQNNILHMLFALLAAFSVTFVSGAALFQLQFPASKQAKFVFSATAGLAIFGLVYYLPPYWERMRSEGAQKTNDAENGQTDHAVTFRWSNGGFSFEKPTTGFTGVELEGADDSTNSIRAKWIAFPSATGERLVVKITRSNNDMPDRNADMRASGAFQKPGAVNELHPFEERGWPAYEYDNSQQMAVLLWPSKKERLAIICTKGSSPVPEYVSSAYWRIVKTIKKIN
jgi:hypothetical protein